MIMVAVSSSVYTVEYTWCSYTVTQLCQQVLDLMSVCSTQCQCLCVCTTGLYIMALTLTSWLTHDTDITDTYSTDIQYRYLAKYTISVQWVVLLSVCILSELSQAHAVSLSIQTYSSTTHCTDIENLLTTATCCTTVYTATASWCMLDCTLNCILNCNAMVPSTCWADSASLWLLVYQ